MSERWVNADGSTNVTGFLAAYAEDSNTFWRVDTGHIQNVLDALLDRLETCPAGLIIGGRPFPCDLPRSHPGRVHRNDKASAVWTPA